MTNTNFFSLRSNKNNKHTDSLKENSTHFRNKSTMNDLSEGGKNESSLQDI